MKIIRFDSAVNSISSSGNRFRYSYNRLFVYCSCWGTIEISYIGKNSWISRSWSRNDRISKCVW